MNALRTAKTALLLGMTLRQAREALETPVEGECFWLGGHCGLPTAPGDWLCPDHRAWRPNLGGTDPLGLLGQPAVAYHAEDPNKPGGGR